MNKLRFLFHNFNLSVFFTGTYLGTNFLEETWDKDVIGQTTLFDFLDNINISVIYSFVEKDELAKKLRFCSDVSYSKYSMLK